MPKTRARKRGVARGGARKQHAPRPTRAPISRLEPVQSTPRAASTTRPAVAPARGIQSLVMSALIAVGCWAFAYYTFLFNHDINSYLFAGLAVLLALVWSINFFVRLRKWRQRR